METSPLCLEQTVFVDKISVNRKSFYCGLAQFSKFAEYSPGIAFTFQRSSKKIRQMKPSNDNAADIMKRANERVN